MKETAKRLTLEAATALMAAGSPPEEVPDQLAKWAREWIEEK